jgi:hypothetical protein
MRAGVTAYGILFGAAITTGCQSFQISKVHPMNSRATEAPVSCRAMLIAAEQSIYSLRFELHNRGAATVELSTLEPFTSFTVTGRAGERPVTVHQPALDIPVRPKTIRVGPNATATIETPIRLRIAEGAEAGNDGFVWTIPHDRKSVSLEVRLNLPAPFDALCPIVFQ